VSTKLYNGRRCKPKDFALVLHLLEEFSKQRAYENLTSWIDRLIAKNPEKSLGEIYVMASNFEMEDRHEHGDDGYIYSMTYAWAQVWYTPSWVYMNLSAPLTKMPEFDALQEYGYWDNVDRPDNISSRSWSQRGARWDAVLTVKHEHGQFAIDFVRYPDVWIMLREICDKKIGSR